MRMEYVLRNGSYYLFDTDQRPNPLTKERDIQLMTDTVALGIERHSGALLKHGKPEVVEAWAAKTMRKATEQDLGDIAGDIIVIAGAFPVAALNQCLATRQCGKLMDSLPTMKPAKGAGLPLAPSPVAKLSPF